MMNLSVDSIDECVKAGKVLCRVEPGEVDTIPARVGDWTLRIIATPAEATQTLVAVPTNSRTRNIYTAGRRAWLKDLGFTDAQIDDYMRASQTVMYRWEDTVAQFVNKYEQMPTDHWNDIYRSRNPRERATELGYTHSMSRNRLMAALQILMNIWEL